MKKAFLLVVLPVAVSGCWTFNESEYPRTAVVSPQGEAAKLAVAITGFDAVVTEYESIYGYSTVYTPGYYGHRHYHPGYYSTVSTQTIVPQTRTTDMFRKRAQEELEDAGFVLATTSVPDRTIDVSFCGPLVDSSDIWCQWGLRLCTVFFCDYEAASWTAKLRIRDNRTGKILFKNEYVQRYQTNAMGLIPIFGIASCEGTSAAHVQSWCLAALTDRVMADATAFLAK